jgi:hypothetical protein
MTSSLPRLSPRPSDQLIVDAIARPSRRRDRKNETTTFRKAHASARRGGERVQEVIEIELFSCEAVRKTIHLGRGRKRPAAEHERACDATPSNICLGCGTLRCGRHSRRPIVLSDVPLGGRCSDCGNTVASLDDANASAVISARLHRRTP